MLIYACLNVFHTVYPNKQFSRAGLGVLFGKLQQGVVENQQILTIARMRADAEESYGFRLTDITPAVDRMAGGFSRDDGASVRKVLKLECAPVRFLLTGKYRRTRESGQKCRKRERNIKKSGPTSGNSSCDHLADGVKLMRHELPVPMTIFKLELRRMIDKQRLFES